jgi:GTP cyclohydrolase I
MTENMPIPEKVTKAQFLRSVQNIIKFVGDDPAREGVRKTPERVMRSMEELCSGYGVDVASVFTNFENDIGYDSIVLFRNVEFYSLCEHHMLPFFGTAHIAYLPDQQIIGLSKLARLLDVFARRLQVQERIGEQVTKVLMQSALKPRGAACIISARHFCVCGRGVGKQHSTMVTSSLTGVFKDQMETRQELMSLIGSGL